MSKEKQALETLVVHGIKTCHTTSMDLVPPIHMTSTFTFNDIDQGAGIFAGTDKGYLYTRISNPTIDLLQEKIAVLEGGEAAIATSSGMAAIAAVTMGLAGSGDNVVVCNAIYGGSFALFHNDIKRYGITTRFISPAQSKSKKILNTMIDDKTRLIFMETPANPTLDIIDITLWAEIAHKKGVPLVVDNTFASPFLQNPLLLGSDLVLHSTTKYLSGHGDLIGGVVTGDKNMIDKIKKNYLDHFGSIISPFNAWLILRGLKTLAVRMERHSDNALTIARRLEKHPKIEEVHYPGLESHPDFNLAARQMKKYSGMISFVTKGGIETGKKFINSVKLCKIAVSLGDCETLIQHPASMTHATYSREERYEAGIKDGLIRISVGLEHPLDIIQDLEQALSRI